MVELHYWLSRTMLIERLAGVGLYAGLLLVMYLLVRSAKDYRLLSCVLNIYTIALCIMAFFYVPGSEADLLRWELVYDEYWRDLTFLEFMENFFLESSTPVAYLYMFLFMRTGIDGLLPAFCALVFYGNIFYIFKDLYRRHQVSTWSLSTVLFFFMASGSFLEVISGVRCFVALSVMARCFYDEVYNNKPPIKNIVWEILAGLTHSMALILLGGRFLFSLIQKNRNPLIKLINVLLSIAAVIFAVRFGREYIFSAFDKVTHYLSGENGYTYFWEYLIGVFMIVQFLVIISKGRWTLRRNPEHYELSNMMLLNLGVLVVEFAVAIEYNTFHRLCMFLTMIIIPVAAEAIEDEKNQGLDRVIWLLSLLVLVFACARGNLSGYKFMSP